MKFIYFIFLWYSIFFSFLSIQLLKTHRNHGDLASYEQAIWNTNQGRFMQTTFAPSVHGFWDLKSGHEAEISDNTSFLGFHFALILLSIAPFYKIFPRSETLLIIQTLVIGLGVFPLYKLVVKKLNSRFLGIVFSLSYLLHPGIIAINLFEFHPDAFTATLFLFMFYFLENKKYLLLFLFAFLASFCKENVSLIVSGFGLLLLFRKNKKEKTMGLVLFTLGLTYFLLVVYVLIPRFSNYGRYIYGGIYGSPLGGSLVQITKNSLTKPFMLVKTLFTKENILYIFKLNSSVAFLFFITLIFFIITLGSAT